MEKRGGALVRVKKNSATMLVKLSCIWLRRVRPRCNVLRPEYTRSFTGTTVSYSVSSSSSAEEEWHPEEMERWEFGRKKLAAMMGEDEKEFTERRVGAALRYLLPTRLTARDVKPFMKHPSQVFDKRKESAFDSNGRPLEAAFYTGYPAYHNLINEIFHNSQLALQDETTENINRDKDTPKFWVKKKVMANILAEEISDIQYRDIVSRLSKLASHPHSWVVSEFIDQFRRSHVSLTVSSKLSSLNTSSSSSGHIRCIGRRKCSVAAVYVSQERGVVTVNSEPLLSYFPLAEQRQQVLYPLVLTEMLGALSINAYVRGGGKTGQAGAIRLAISRALTGLPGEHTSLLEKAGLLVRDPRAVERKKPGQKKARKKFTWVKR